MCVISVISVLYILRLGSKELSCYYRHDRCSFELLVILTLIFLFCCGVNLFNDIGQLR